MGNMENKRLWNEISSILNDDQMVECFDHITNERAIMAVSVVRAATDCGYNDGLAYVKAIRWFLESPQMSGDLVSGLAELVGE